MSMAEQNQYKATVKKVLTFSYLLILYQSRSQLQLPLALTSLYFCLQYQQDSEKLINRLTKLFKQGGQSIPRQIMSL